MLVEIGLNQGYGKITSSFFRKNFSPVLSSTKPNAKLGTIVHLTRISPPAKHDYNEHNRRIATIPGAAEHFADEQIWLFSSLPLLSDGTRAVHAVTVP